MVLLAATRWRCAVGLGDTNKCRTPLPVSFARRCADNPEYASQVGQHAHDARLQDLSPAAFEARMQHNRSVLAQVEALAAEVAAEEGEAARRRALHLELFRKSVADELDALSLRCHLYPVNSIGYGGVHNNFTEALDWLSEDGRAANLLSRLEAFEAQAESYKALLRQGIAEQRVASKAMVRKVPEQLSALLKELDDASSPSTLDSLLAAVPADLRYERGVLAQAATTIDQRRVDAHQGPGRPHLRAQEPLQPLTPPPRPDPRVCRVALPPCSGMGGSSKDLCFALSLPP